MKANLYYGKKDIRYEEMEIPEITSEEILIKMEACGLCGTDIQKIL